MEFPTFMTGLIVLYNTERIFGRREPGRMAIALIALEDLWPRFEFKTTNFLPKQNSR